MQQLCKYIPAPGSLNLAVGPVDHHITGGVNALYLEAPSIGPGYLDAVDSALNPIVKASEHLVASKSVESVLIVSVEFPDVDALNRLQLLILIEVGPSGNIDRQGLSCLSVGLSLLSLAHPVCACNLEQELIERIAPLTGEP